MSWRELLAPGLQAVDLWRASVQQQPQQPASNPADQQQAQQVQQPQARQQGGAAAAVPSPEQRQQYEASMKPLVFQVTAADWLCGLRPQLAGMLAIERHQGARRWKGLGWSARSQSPHFLRTPCRASR